MIDFSAPVTAGTVLVRSAIQSPNFVSGAGGSGWSINQAGDVEFNSGVFRGTVTGGTFAGTTFIINSAGAFFYSGTPANGNLIASIAASGGTDAFGNVYHAVMSAGNQNGAYTRIGNTGIIHMQNAAGNDVLQLDPTRSAILIYSGAPAVGNLVVSLAAAAGTDPLGNAFPAGLNVTTGTVSGTTISGSTVTGSTVTGGTVQTAASGQRVLMSGANGDFEAYDSAGHLVGRWAPGTPDLTQLNNSLLQALQVTAGQIYWAAITAAGVVPTPAQIAAATYLSSNPGFSLALNSGNSGGADAAQLVLHNGTAGGTYANGPYLDLGDTNATTNLALVLAGAAISRTPAGVRNTWQLPSYGLNWSGSTTFNTTTGVEPCRFRIDAEDNLWIIGGFKAGATAPSDPVFILPAGYFPAAGTDYIPALRNAAGVVTAGMLRISNNGHVDVLNSANLPIGASNEYLINGKIPLRNIT